MEHGSVGSGRLLSHATAILRVTDGHHVKAARGRNARSGKLRRGGGYVDKPLLNSPNRRPAVAILNCFLRCDSTISVKQDVISVTVDPPEPTVRVGQAQTFEAVVKATHSTRIRWSVEEQKLVADST